MNDYKKLIEDLRTYACPAEEDEHYAMLEAANAISKLVKERDAAVADLRKLSYCSNCQLCTETDDDDYYWCSVYCDWNEYNDTCEHWEWRGVK